MNAQKRANKISVNATEGATEEVTKNAPKCGTKSENDLHSTKMTKEEVQQKTDEELIQMIQKSQGFTGKEFSDRMNCDFSYSYLTGLLKKRGYENGWHKTTSEGSSPIVKPVVLQMKKSDDEVSRQSYMVEKSVADEWKQFNKNVPYKTVTLGWALRRFMDDVRSGRVKFELEL